MTNKQFYSSPERQTEPDQRDKAVQFGCWLTVNYYYVSQVNRFAPFPSAVLKGFKRGGMGEDLFDFWLNIEYGIR